MMMKPGLPEAPRRRPYREPFGAACRWAGIAGGSLCWLASHAHAAGGHHAVDDAAILDPGQCEVEAWMERERHGARALSHIGPACRVGPVELGLNLDRTRADGARPRAVAGPQLKWAHAWTGTVSVGVLLGAAWADRAPRSMGRALVFPVSWQASDALALHLNIGKDFRRGREPDTLRAGAALEWAARPAWSFVAEAVRDSGARHWRAGARHVLAQGLSIDLSRAQGLDGGPPAWWTLGLNWEFSR